MAVKRALVYRAGSVGLVCAAFEVAIERGTEGREGTIRPIRECTELATELWVTGDTSTGFCAGCAEVIARSPNTSVVRAIQRPRNN
jgi:hypothetical protein